MDNKKDAGVVFVPLPNYYTNWDEDWGREFRYTLEMDLPPDPKEAHKLMGEIAHALACAGYSGEFRMVWAYEKYTIEFDRFGTGSDIKDANLEPCEACGNMWV